MPTYTRPASLSIDNTEAVTGGESGYKPRKISAMSTLSVQVGYPLKSALKNSTGNLNQENSGPIPTVVTSPPPTELRPSGLETRRGSHLGRSKSVKINRVKFGEAYESENQGRIHSNHKYQFSCSEPRYFLRYIHFYKERIVFDLKLFILFPLINRVRGSMQLYHNSEICLWTSVCPFDTERGVITIYLLIWYLSSVTKLGDLLDFGQLFKAFGSN